MTRDPRKPTAHHSHDCCECGFTWTCEHGTKCKVVVAAKVNKDGPFCELCRHAIMAIRYAAARRMDLFPHILRLMTREERQTVNA